LSFADYLPLFQAIEIATGQTPHKQTCRRWVKLGIKGIRLEAKFINGSYWATVDAVKQFVESTSEARLQITEAPRLDPVKPVKPARVNAAIKEFERMTKPAKAKS
jgi:hypothetical protein